MSLPSTFIIPVADRPRHITNLTNRIARYRRLGTASNQLLDYYAKQKTNVKEHGVYERPGDVIPTGYQAPVALTPMPKSGKTETATTSPKTDNNFIIYNDPVVNTEATKQAFASWDGTGDMPKPVFTERTINRMATHDVIHAVAKKMLALAGLDDEYEVRIHLKTDPYDPNEHDGSPADSDDEEESDDEAEAEESPKPNAGAGKPTCPTCHKQVAHRGACPKA